VAVLNVAPLTAPSITTQPTNQSDQLGITGSFAVAATGTPTPTYQWNEVLPNGTTNILNDSFVNGDGETYSGSINTELFVSNFTTNDSGNYYFVTISNTAGSTNSQNAYLTVLLVPPAVTVQPLSQANASGQSVTFSVTATGSYLGYQWYFITNGGGTNLLSDGAGLSGESYTGSATTGLTINKIQTNDIGYYFVEVTNTASATNSMSALLGVIQLPPPSVIVYSNAGSVYLQNFDSLPSFGTFYTNSVNAANPAVINGTNYSFGIVSPQFDFAAPILSNGIPGGLGLSNTMSGWYGWSQGGSGANTNYFGVNCGDFTTGGIQDYGPTNSYAASTNRALGLQTTSSFGPAAFAARFTNGTAVTFSNINLSYTGELWRQSTLAKSLTFHYVVDNTGTNTFDANPADYFYLSSLDVNFPTNAADAGGTNATGTLLMSTNISVSNQPITNWSPGAVLWLVWSYTNTTGKAQGIGIDDLSFSAIAAPTVATAAATGVTSSGATLNATVNPNGAATAYWFLYGTNSLFNNNTPTNTLSAGSNPQSVNISISGLLPGTAYQYQIVATNVVNASSDAGTNFTTSAALTPPMAVVTNLTSAIGFTPLSVTFSNLSMGATNYLWSFGDGVTLTTSQNTNVSYSYTTGIYTNILTVYGLGGTNAATNVNSIVVKPQAVLSGTMIVGGTSFIFGGTNGPAGVQFRIVSTNNLTVPLSNWPTVFAGTFNMDGSYNYTNTSATNSAGFFRLVSP
jgi:hypothetical protein